MAIYQRAKESQRKLWEWVERNPYPFGGDTQEWEQRYREEEAKLGLAKQEFFKCQVCKDHGFLLEGEQLVACSCNTISAHALHKYSNVPDRRIRDTFKSFSLREAPLMQEAYTAAIEFAQGYSAVPWLLIFGPIGCGKTHLAYAVANEMAQHGWKVKMWIVPDLLDAIRGTYQKENQQEIIEEMVYEPEVLILDDLGSEKLSDWVAEKLFQVIDRRYREGRPLMVTTNENLDRLPDRLKSRFSDAQICRVITTEAPDFRPKLPVPKPTLEPQEVRRSRKSKTKRDL